MAYSNYLFHDSSFSYVTTKMAGTKYAVQLCEEHSISDTYTTSFLHSAIAWHLIEISGLLLFASSEKLNPPFRAKWVSGMKIVWLLMLPYYSLMGGWGTTQFVSSTPL